ncbi:MAG: hypothetical protein E6I13_00185 [Chloroflexi bacterium]|nr:MAG: hypothetical protein E6I13_00185 [Chloroflexota bacterium]
MQLENSFRVNAPPDRVFAYLLDVNKVVGCVPGAELSEVVDSATFKGKVKIKVGPVTVAYSGTARISDRNDAQRTATLTADGRETTGPGSARASAEMRVHTAGEGSTVEIVTEYHVAGRIAQRTFPNGWFRKWPTASRSTSRRRNLMQSKRSRETDQEQRCPSRDRKQRHRRKRWLERSTLSSCWRRSCGLAFSVVESWLLTL